MLHAYNQAKAEALSRLSYVMRNLSFSLLILQRLELNRQKIQISKRAVKTSVHIRRQLF